MPDDEDARADDRLEALRRGLYRRGAAQGEVERYLAERPAVVAEAERPASPPHRRPYRWAVVAAGALVLAAVLVLGLQPGTAPTDGAPRIEQPQRTVPAGQVVTPYGATVPLPTPVAVSADGEAAAGQRYRGTGDARFPLDLADAPLRRGRIVVAVTALDAEPVRWRSVAVDPDASPAEHVFASGPSATAPGEPVVAVLPYAAGPPALLEIAAATDARWTADVAFLPAAAPTLR